MSTLGIIAMEEQMEEDLLLASENGNINAMTEIIDNGFRIDAVITYEGMFGFGTALMVASLKGHTKYVKRLLELGADIYIDEERIFDKMIIASDYHMAMIEAARRGHLECVQVMAEIRLFKNKVYENPYKELIIAAKRGNFDCIQALLAQLKDEGLLKGWKGHNLMNLLLLYRCPPSSLQILIDHGVGVNGWDLNGLTPLMCAIMAGNVQCVQFLLQKEVDVLALSLETLDSFENDGSIADFVFQKETTKARQGRIALIYAACMENIQILQFMLESMTKEDINFIEMNDGYSPLMYAAYTGNVESVSLLLKFGANANHCDYGERSALCSAIPSDNVECFELLLKNVDETNYTLPFHLCITNNSSNLLSIFLNYFDGFDFDDSSWLTCAILSDSLECARLLIQSGHMVDFSNIFGRTVLMFACSDGRDKGVELLIEHGADVNAQSGDGQTAAMIAVSNKHVKCLQILMDYRANLDVIDIYGGTVFSCAMLGDGCCMELLLSSGKVFEDKNKKALKPLHSDAVSILDPSCRFSMKSVLLTMKYNVFDWKWCSHPDSGDGFLNLSTSVFAAVNSGISPAMSNHDNIQTSPLLLAFIKQDVSTFKYIIANLYFVPEDYTFLSQKSAIFTDISRDVDSRKETASVFVNFVSSPLNLQTWSFLTISKAICSAGFSNDRYGQVDSLPLPTELKKKLKFKSCLSNLCYRLWKDIGSESKDKQLANLIFEKQSFWKHPDYFAKCTRAKCKCEGYGRIYEAT